MTRYLQILLAYDGAAFAGWQVQPQQRTVQAVVESAWREVSGESAAVVASGRTDAGVHALGQVCGVATRCNIPCQGLANALNANLPEDIRVLRVDPAPENFDPVRDARRKTYRYLIQTGRVPHLFWRRYAWHVRGKLRTDLMQQAAERLVGEHDFVSFQTTGSERLSTVRTIYRLEVNEPEVEGRTQLQIEVTANGFLYNMARNLVGTLVLVGQEKAPPIWVDEVLAARDRRAAGPAAPAHGLFLVNVEYDF